MKASELIKILESAPDKCVALSVGDKFPRSVKLVKRVERDVFIFILCSD